MSDKTFSQVLNFTRASTGTYFDSAGVLQTAAVDEPRFAHDPATLEAEGLLIEEQRTNLLLWSEAFDDAVWAKDDASVTPNAVASPDSNTTADEIVENTNSTSHRIKQAGISITSGVNYTSKVFVKKGNGADRNFAIIFFDGAGGWSASARLDTTTLSVTPAGSSYVSHNIKELPDGWIEFSVSVTAEANSSTGVVLFSLYDGTSGIYTGDGVSSLYLWGAQLEQGSFPTSYIKTEGSQVTRSADNCSRTLGSEFNASDGTFFVEGIADIGIDDITYYLQVNVASTEYLRMFIDGAGSRESELVVLWRNSSQTSISSSNSAVPPGSVFKMAFSFNDSNKDLTLSVNGTLYGPVSYAHESPSLSGRNLHIGNDVLPNKRFLNRTTKYYPRALSATELQELTAP